MDEETKSFTIKVEAQNGEQRTYTLTIKKDINYQYLVNNIIR